MLLLLALAAPVHAETYRMDLIVFVDRYAATEAGTPATLPDLAGAILPDNPAALQAAGITLLPDAAFGLQSEWQRLRNSKRFAPLVRLASTQADPPSANGPALRVRWGAPSPTGTTPVDGRVMLLIVNRYLTLDADLLYTAGTSSWRLDTRRRMRRDELHHLDSARLGILARVTKANGS
ncbi:MAG TPA: CsiV family protein [Solimonas sp.]|nr:CsiV family protein [Solimonas sp.]